jgi:hypothetical protein
MRGGISRPEDPPPTGFPRTLSPQLHFMKRAASEDDWFAWATLGWFLIEGDFPFPEEDLAASARLQKLARVRPSRIPSRSPLGEALRGCLLLVPQDRARTIAKVPQLLQEARQEEEILRPKAYSSIQRGLLPVRKRTSPPPSSPEISAEDRSNIPLFRLLLVFLLAGILMRTLSRSF